MPEQHTDYHFVITIQSSQGKIGGVEGTAQLVKGSTRKQAYQDIRAGAVATLAMPEDSVVLFFSLEPNALT